MGDRLAPRLVRSEESDELLEQERPLVARTRFGDRDLCMEGLEAEYQIGAKEVGTANAS